MISDYFWFSSVQLYIIIHKYTYTFRVAGDFNLVENFKIKIIWL